MPKITEKTLKPHISHKKSEEFWVNAAREPGMDGILAFTYYVFGFIPENFHIGWLKQFFSEEDHNTVVVAPRGSAKTTYLCIALIKFIADNPWSANVLLSTTAHQAQARLKFIREAFDNERFQRVYPWLKIDTSRPDTRSQFTIWDTRMEYSKWRADISRMGGDFKSATLYVAGAGGQGVVGSRVSNGVLALDDVSDDKNSRTAELRLQLWQWLVTTVMPILSGARSRIWAIGTLWAEGDVVSRLIDSGEFTHSEIKAIVKDEKTGKLKSYWKKLFPFKTLLKILNMVGKTSFMLSYLNNITGLAGAIFTADMLRTDYDRDEDGKPIFPEFEKIILSVDAALKTKESNDDSAIAIIGLRTSPHTSLPQMWILQIRYGHWKNMEVLENLESMWAIALGNYKADDYYVLFETVAGQSLFLTLMEQKPDFSIPQKDIQTYSPIHDKGTRARPAATAGERGDLILDLKASWYPKFFSQCIEFTGEQGQEDDLVDVVTQVAIYEFGDIGSYASFNASYTRASIAGLTL